MNDQPFEFTAKSAGVSRGSSGFMTSITRSSGTNAIFEAIIAEHYFEERRRIAIRIRIMLTTLAKTKPVGSHKPELSAEVKRREQQLLAWATGVLTDQDGGGTCRELLSEVHL